MCLGMIAALYVQKNGCYFGVDGVDPWDEERDARGYGGPWPVVAHPPCARWCLLAPLVESKGGAKKWEDGGLFARALAQVRAYGGVLEHPAYTKAWEAHGINRPPAKGGWIPADGFGGWTCHVEQAHYGHLARKPTWLYLSEAVLPRLRWGRGTGTKSINGSLPELTRKERKATPPEFRDLLISIAESAAE